MILVPVKTDNPMLAGSTLPKVQFISFFVFWFFLSFWVSLKYEEAEVSPQRVVLCDALHVCPKVLLCGFKCC